MIDQTAQRTMQVPGQGIIPRGRPTTDYKEYPKMMTHPQYQPGKPSEPIKHPSGFTYHGIGTPIRFPPVLVKTPDDEAYHTSLGYESQGKCDPAAFDRAVGAGQIPDQVAYVPIEYPKWVQGKLCNNQEEENAWIAKCGGSPDTLVVANTPEVDTEVKTLLDRPDLAAKTMEQLRIEDLEAKVDRLVGLLAKATAPDGPMVIDGLEQRAGVVPRKPDRPKKAARKMPALTSDQKQRRSEAIKAGMARKKALAESESVAQDDSAPVA